MQEKAFRDLCSKRKLSKEATESAVKSVLEFEQHLSLSGKTFESATVDDLKQYIALLVSGKEL